MTAYGLMMVGLEIRGCVMENPERVVLPRETWDAIELVLLGDQDLAVVKLGETLATALEDARWPGERQRRFDALYNTDLREVAGDEVEFLGALWHASFHQSNRSLCRDHLEHAEAIIERDKRCQFCLEKLGNEPRAEVVERGMRAAGARVIHAGCFREDLMEIA